MGRSGKNKKAKIGQNMSRAEVRSRAHLPAPNENSVVIGIADEVLVYYSPEEKELYMIDIGLEIESGSEYADQEHFDEVEYELAEAIARALKEGRSVEDISVTRDFEIDVYDGPSYDRMEQRFSEKLVTVEGYAGIKPDSEIWHEDKYEVLLNEFHTEKSREVLAILKEKEEKKREEKKMERAENPRVKKPIEGSILDKTIIRGRNTK